MRDDSGSAAPVDAEASRTTAMEPRFSGLAARARIRSVASGRHRAVRHGSSGQSHRDANWIHGPMSIPRSEPCSIAGWSPRSGASSRLSSRWISGMSLSGFISLDNVELSGGLRMDSEPVAPILVELTELIELLAGLDPEVEPRRFPRLDRRRFDKEGRAEPPPRCRLIDGRQRRAPAGDPAPRG